MRVVQWTVLVILLVTWFVARAFDIGGSSIRGLIAMVIVVLCVFLIVGRRRDRNRA